MKKLILLSALLIFACSSDDSNNNSNITFFEKYNGIVWEEVTEFDYLNRIQFLNGNIVTINAYFVEDQYEDCVSNLLYSTYIIELNEDSFVIFNEVSNNGVDESFTTTVTAFNGGNELITQDSDDPDYPDYFVRTALTNPCE
ncbi:MAG: hypothetical protein ACON30_07560 [Flavobacteriaceae bacterium]